MKKVKVIIALWLGVSFGVLAQENVSIGPIAGVSISNLRGDIGITKWKPGFTIGGFYNYSSNSGLGVSGQVLFTQLGADAEANDDYARLNYIQVPILLTYFLGKYGTKVRPKIFIGPHVNFLLNAQNKRGDNLNADVNDKEIRGIDAGLTAGLGLNFKLKNKIWLNADVRYGLGLVDIAQRENRKLHNQNFGVNLGVSFPFGTFNTKTGRLKTR